MKRNCVVIRYEAKNGNVHETSSKVLFGGTREECERYCESKPHYHSIYDSFRGDNEDVWWDPRSGFYRVIQVGA